MALVGLSLAVACDDDNGQAARRLSVEEYFQGLASIAADTEQREAAAAPTDDPGASPQEIKQRWIDYLNDVASILDAAADDVGELLAPEDVKDQHDALVTAIRNLVASFEGFATESEDLPTEEIEDFVGLRTYAAEAYAAFEQACGTLQRIADADNISVDLCEPADED